MQRRFLPFPYPMMATAPEGTAARLKTDGMSLIVVATKPSFTRLWVLKKSSCLDIALISFWHESVPCVSLNAVRKLLQAETPEMPPQR
jgi:hypothetical protein